jgi:hypothetical protein
MKIRLTKISRPDVAGGLRTNTVDGITSTPLEVGRSLVMTAESLTIGASMRFIETTPITAIDVEEGTSKRTITTETGSVYEVEEI